MDQEITNKEINSQQTLFYILVITFLVSFFLFFIVPIFFNDENVMLFPEYIRAKDVIGMDLRSMQYYVGNWFYNHQSPYFDGFVYYPPFAILFFLIFTLIPFKLSYMILSCITIILFVLLTFFIPYKYFNKSSEARSFVVLVFLTAIFSYGFQFELERGQFNVIAFACAFLSVYIFHRAPRYRIAAYILLTAAIQMKVYPAIFVFLLIDQKDNFSAILKRFLSLAGANLLMLFILGWNVFSDFLKSITYQLGDPQTWSGNHSAKSFVTFLTNLCLDQTEHQRLWIIEDYQNTIFIALMVIIFICVLIGIYFALRYKLHGFQHELFLIFTTAALIIPTVSHDYTLSLLSLPISLFIGNELSHNDGKQQKIRNIFLTLIFFCYGSTLFSNTNKIDVLKNNFPALLIILVLSTILFLIKQSKTNQSDLKR